jgi:glucose/arabinose dehydrogenase
LLRRVIFGLLALLLLTGFGLALLLWFGPVQVGGKRAFLDFMLGRDIQAPTAAQVRERLRPAPGWQVEVYADDVPLARVLRLTSSGDLLVSRTRAGEVTLLLRDANGDGRPDGQRALLTGLDRPHGLELHEGWLYVAETTAVGRVRFDEQRGAMSGEYTRILTGLTGDGFHLTRTLRLGPDGALYLAQGSSCNSCVEKDPRRATIMRLAPDGSEATIHASGLRNSVDFDWAPWDGSLYATENSRDLLGDDLPPDELNRIVAGGFYGWPYLHGRDIVDPELGQANQAEVARAIHPVHGFNAHNAPLGIRFLRASAAVPGYERAALVALHGSWNRREPDGYKVVSLHWAGDDPVEERDFLTGFLSPDGILGRPSFIEEAADGTVYLSDDYAGVIYRITRTKAAP